MKMLAIITTLFTLGSAFVLSSCGQGSGAGADTGNRAPVVNAAEAGQLPIAYDLDNPEVYTLPGELREVSGIRFYKGDPSLLYAQQDEKGRLYWLPPGGDKASHYDFGKDGDYEDLAFVAGQAVFLKSNGHLYGFDFLPAGDPAGKPEAGKLQEWKGLLPDGEYEGLYADTGKKQLYVLCKECKNEDHEKTVTVFRLDHNEQGWHLSGSSQIDVTKIADLYNSGRKKKKSKKVDFKPSAICLNPRTQQWYILSSVNKMLVVTGIDWQVKAVCSLDRKHYPQPEGMCFDRDNNLYISNEGPKGSEGTVLKLALQEN